MSVFRVPIDTLIEGNLTVGGDINPASGQQFDPARMRHEHASHFGQNGAMAAERRFVYEVRGSAATILGFRAGAATKAVGAGSGTVDLQKGGVSILSAPIALDSSDSNYVSKAGTVTGASLVSGDVLEVVTTATAGGGTVPQGAFASLRIKEDYSG